jgi:RNA polymerase sigma-70 factor (ECF subfamily)
VRPEVLLVQKGARIRFPGLSGNDAVVDLRYVEIPVLLRIAPGAGAGRWFIAAGPTFAFKVRARVDASDSGGPEDVDVDSQVRSADAGAAIGGGVDVRRWSFEARLVQGSLDIGNTRQVDEPVRTRTFSFLASVRFSAMDDRTLVREMLAGREAAFDEFFATYFPRLFRFALRRLDSHDAAEDMVQATLVTAVRKLSTWRGEATLFSWLCTICRHELGEHWRTSPRDAVIGLIDDVPEVRARLESLAADLNRLEDQIDRRQLAELVQIALDILPGRYRDVLEWKYIQGLTVAEIAERLRSTPKAVESMLSRARDAFRDGFSALAEGRR